MTTPDTSPTEVVKLVRCPTCGGDSIYASVNSSRPFCSIRCKNIDLGAWANEDFRMANQTPEDAFPPPGSSPNL